MPYKKITVEHTQDGCLIRGEGLILFNGDCIQAHKILLHWNYTPVVGTNGIWVKL